MYRLPHVVSQTALPCHIPFILQSGLYFHLHYSAESSKIQKFPSTPFIPIQRHTHLFPMSSPLEEKNPKVRLVARVSVTSDPVHSIPWRPGATRTFPELTGYRLGCSPILSGFKGVLRGAAYSPCSLFYLRRADVTEVHPNSKRN